MDLRAGSFIRHALTLLASTILLCFVLLFLCRFFFQAEKPDDWDDEEDGEWEPAMIKNPEYKGKWKAKMIPNPDYKGPWEHPMVPNPDYKGDAKLGQRCNACTHIGFELWQASKIKVKMASFVSILSLLLVLVWRRRAS